MENNIFNMNNMSKETIRKAAKYEKAAADFLKEHDESIHNEIAAGEKKSLNEAMSAARFAMASSYARSKNRVNKLNEEIAYTNDSSVIGMTEMVAEVVEKSLLLDESEFEAIHPNYKEEIRDIVRGLLENAEVEENISNRETLALMEYVARTLPGVKEGVLLTEDELSAYIGSRKDINVDSAISKLAGNVSSRVASLMEKEQKKIDLINDEIEAATGKSAAPVAEEAEEVPEDGEMAPEEAEGGYEEIPEEAEGGYEEDPEAAEAQYGEEGEEMPAEGYPAGGEMDPSHLAMARAMMPKKQIQMAPDGTMMINIFEELDRYDECQALLEKYNLEKDLDKNAKKLYGKTARKVNVPLSAGALGISGATVGASAGAFAGPLGVLLGGGIGAVIGALLGAGSGALSNKIIDDTNNPRIVALKKAAKSDPKCMQIINSIKTAIARQDKDKLKELKKEFAERLKELRDDEEAGRQTINTHPITESLVREAPRCGLIESLAVNNAANMIKEGKEYNPDLALADAIMYVTITEALDEMGIMLVNDNKYKTVTEAAGGRYSLEEARKPAGSLLDKNVKANLKVLKAQHKPLNESVICSQEAPRMNSSSADSMAERIRQRKLLKEQNQTLHD